MKEKRTVRKVERKGGKEKENEGREKETVEENDRIRGRKKKEIWEESGKY